MAKAQKVFSTETNRPIWETDVCIRVIFNLQEWLQHQTAEENLQEGEASAEA